MEARLCLGADYKEASQDMFRNAMRAGMIPSINSMMGVGIVFIPGMMTGQILAGADPVQAICYQIIVGSCWWDQRPSDRWWWFTWCANCVSALVNACCCSRKILSRQNIFNDLRLRNSHWGKHPVRRLRSYDPNCFWAYYDLTNQLTGRRRLTGSGYVFK